MEINVLKSPALQVILGVLRNKKTVTTDFRRNLRYAGYLMTHEIMMHECTMRSTAIMTPLTKAKGAELKEKILQVIVMRAGEPFADGGARLLDEINSVREIGVVDAHRVEKPGFKFEIVMGSFKVPKFDKNTIVVVYDPMLATASTLTEILKRLKKHGTPKKFIVCSIIAAEYGLNKLQKHFPDLIVYTLGVDKKLNSRGYIVPGLGDCGDRAFGTY